MHKLKPEEGEAERRFDAAAQQRIIALAARLQEEQVGTLTEGELEQAAAEAGLEPRFVRQAVALVEREGMCAPARRRGATPKAWSRGCTKIVMAALLLEALLGVVNRFNQTGGAVPLVIPAVLGLLLGLRRRTPLAGAATFLLWATIAEAGTSRTEGVWGWLFLPVFGGAVALTAGLLRAVWDWAFATPSLAVQSATPKV